MREGGNLAQKQRKRLKMQKVGHRKTSTPPLRVTSNNMLYFTPEDSKKLEELGLDTTRVGATWTYRYMKFSTLDICELENARKLWDSAPPIDMTVIVSYQFYLQRYITLTDKERIKYVSDYLATL